VEREGAAKRKKKKKELLNFCFQVFGFFSFSFVPFLLLRYFPYSLAFPFTK